MGNRFSTSLIQITNSLKLQHIHVFLGDQALNILLHFKATVLDEENKRDLG